MTLPDKKQTHQPSPKVLACRENGRKGGLARAKNNPKKLLKTFSSKGGQTTADNYGVDYFKYIAARRQNVGRYRKPVAKTNVGKKKVSVTLNHGQKLRDVKYKPDSGRSSNRKAVSNLVGKHSTAKFARTR